MYCMKCGKETEESQVFCQDCLQVMERYPIKPDIAVHIPKRTPRPAEKKQPRKKEASPEPLQQQYKLLVRWLLVAVFVLTVLLCLAVGLLFETYVGQLSFFQSF